MVRGVSSGGVSLRTRGQVADQDGVSGDVVLGFSDVAGWASAANPCFNCTVGVSPLAHIISAY